MSIPAIVWCLLMAMSLGINAANHGMFRRTSFFQAMIGCSLQAVILYWGGFFL